MAEPDYLLCIECESPVYIFEWRDGAATEAFCPVCGNDELSQFMTESDYDELVENSLEFETDEDD